MHFHYSFYSVLLLIFFSQGCLFAILLFKKGWQAGNRADYWLSGLIALCSLYLVPWMMGFAGWYGKQPYRDILFYIPFQQLLLIGPVIYCYTKSILNPGYQLKAKEWWHFAPAGLYLLYSALVWITDQCILHQYYFYANGRDKDLDTWYQLAGLLSISFYCLLSLRYYRSYKKVLYQTSSNTTALLFDWINHFLIALISMQIIRLISFIMYPNWGSFVGKWWYYVGFAILMYYIALTGYVNQVKGLVQFTHSKQDATPVFEIEDADPTILPPAKQPFQLPEPPLPTNNPEEPQPPPEPIAEEWKAAVLDFVVQQKGYEQPNLSLLEVAQALRTHPTQISKIINQGFQMNFNDFVNHYRILAVKALFEKGNHQQETLLSIAYECGFNAKTTFNRCFKKHTGLTPKAYIQSLSVTPFKNDTVI